MTSAHPSPPRREERIHSVAELNRMARGILEANFPLLWVGGEISNLSYAASGHIYFSLKDEAAQVRCAMWRNRAQLLGFRLANGMKVEARALVTLYEPRGDYQLNVEALRHAGVGALSEAYFRLKERLLAEGLFDAARKRALPRYPHGIGVVTSLQAAALRDVLAALRRRAPAVPVIIYPAPVQGEGAAAALTRAVETAGRRGECEVLILCRGGGSIEDLWAFNDEALARAIVACPIPVVSGVGHETDVSIADFAADQRAATPTAAAELVSAGYAQAAAALAALSARMRHALRQRLHTLQQRVDIAAGQLLHPGERLARSRLQLAHQATRLSSAAQRGGVSRAARLERLQLRLQAAAPQPAPQRARLEQLDQGLRASLRRGLERRAAQLDALAAALSHLDPRQVLTRGYSIVRDAQGRPVKDSGDVAAGSKVDIQFARGGASADITSTR